MQIDLDNFCLRNITSEDAESYYELYSHPEVAKYDDFTCKLIWHASLSTPQSVRIGNSLSPSHQQTR